MKIKSIRLKNFRSIGDSIEIHLPQICAFVGANNAGKSNILSALNKVLGKDWITVNNFNDEDVYQKNAENDIQIDIEFEEAFRYETYRGFEPSLIQSMVTTGKM